jgi:hypothetical protein
VGRILPTGENPMTRAPQPSRQGRQFAVPPNLEERDNPRKRTTRLTVDPWPSSQAEHQSWRYPRIVATKVANDSGGTGLTSIAAAPRSGNNA